jgi:preprotein translocase subunit Sec61beta
MSVRQERVSMPMGSAGIIGFSSDVKLSGIEIDPKVLMITTVLIVIIVHIATYVVK